MKCPDCDSEIDNPPLGNFKCPQCKSRLLIFPSEAKPNTGRAVEGNTAGYLNGRVSGRVTRKFRSQGPQEELRFFCAGCSKRVNPALSRTGKVLEGLQFLKSSKIEIHIPQLGQLDTWERSYILTGTPQQVRISQTRPFIKYNKGFLCDGCASLTGTWKDRSGKEHPLVIVEGLKPSGHVEVPAYEKLPSSMPTTPQVFNDSLQEHCRTQNNSTDNHWLNVGRKR